VDQRETGNAHSGQSMNVSASHLLSAALGGLIIGTATAGLLLANGRVAGISGIIRAALSRGCPAWPWAFLLGLAASGLMARVLGLAVTGTVQVPSLGVLLAAGLLVGFGSRLGSGCTSGHGVCGLSNLSSRSLVATGLFMTAAGLTVFVVRHLPG
jgi:uncharacterized membrane protein YedE/YeeE